MSGIMSPRLCKRSSTDFLSAVMKIVFTSLKRDFKALTPTISQSFNGILFSAKIVELSELREFLDVPVQNFSSGMVARLAFSVATIVEPEILIVDEILSVGDIAFQAKSEQKMLGMIEGGTTVLFVSHSIEQIKKLCDKVVWLEHGVVQKIGGKEVCDEYLAFMGAL